MGYEPGPIVISENTPAPVAAAAATTFASTPAPTSNFTDYSSVQAALDYEYLQWAAGYTTGPTEQGLAAREYWNNYNAPTSGGGGGYTVASVPPNPWITTSTYVAPTGVKQATPDIVVFDNSTVDLEFLTDTFFEEFGGQELIKISRADLIDGKEVSYNPIKNLSRLNQQYNPNTIIAIAPFQQNLSAYAIDLILRGINEPYVDRENGYLVVEIDNVKRDESIEVEIATSGTMNRIIYDY